MSWIVIALASAVVGSGISIADKTLLQNYVRSHVTLQLFIGSAGTASGLVFVAASAWSGGVTVPAILTAVFSGAIFGFGGLFLIYVLNTQEVSRAVPVTQTAPVFAAILAFLFLDEALTAIQWQAVVATVAGAILLSVGRDGGYHRLALHRSFSLLMVASVIMAVGHVVSKVPLDTLSVPLVHGLRCLGLGAVFLGASFSNRDARADMMHLIQSGSAGLAIVSFSELVLVNASFLLFLWALSEGPVGLVTAVIATRSLFILLLSTLLSLRFRDMLGEHVTPGALVVKIASVTLIVAGVGVIALG